MSTIRERMIEDMQLHGYSAKTQTAYLGAVRGLAGHYHRTPEDITQDELRSYFLYLVKERGVARGTLTIHLSGIKFFFEKTLKREWLIFNLVRPKKRTKLPVVLSPDEVKHILSLVKTPAVRMALTVIADAALGAQRQGGKGPVCSPPGAVAGAAARVLETAPPPSLFLSKPKEMRASLRHHPAKDLQGRSPPKRNP